MEVRLKFSKEESEAFKNWKEKVKPQEVTDDVFVKQIFFLGCNTFNANLKSMMEQHMSNLQAQKEAEESKTEPSEQTETQ